MNNESILWGRFLFYWLPVVFYAGIIFYLSSLSIPHFRSPFPYYDKVIPAIEYAILAILLYRALQASLQTPLARLTGVLVVLVCTLYGITDEYHQSFVPTRVSDFYDLMADTTGAVLGVLLTSLKNRRI